MTSERPWAQWLRLIAINILVFLVLGEVSTRLLWAVWLSRDADLVHLHDYVFGFGESEGAGKVTGLVYRPHLYLGFSLNPDRMVDGARPINADYLIRRAEPIRPRAEVSRRVLVLGGSTTFDTHILAERDTWVAQLEGLARAKHGVGVDVINGGVGAYMVYENTIHYATLLKHLEPDVVILFEGINDVPPRLLGEIAPDYRNYNLERYSLPNLGRIQSPLRHSALFRVVILELRYRPLAQEGIRKAVRHPLPKPAEWAAALERNGPEIYRSALSTLVTLLRAEGRSVVILPQYFVPRKEGDEIYILGVRQHNEVSRQVASEHGVPFLAALSEAPPFGPDDTVDNCHFNPTGAAKMARLVFDFLEQERLL
jgi:lysophospholipase L1-like esterase